MSRIVIYTFGSLGDLNPYLSIGLELKELGFDVIIATSDIYKDTVEKNGLSFHLVRPLFSNYINNEEIAKKAMDLKRGGEFIIKEVIYGHIEESYEDLFSIASTADLLITHSICYAGPIVAEKLKMP
ncbi:glycosyltransferase [Mucilaginibacter sp.]|uniref:glycosyltransferase n=1 Tax=Mucilaginibacter sp. TaxID=1882438 RepID=UPI0025E4AE47|nr:glycosyltransferase [Mucilaginibacter sp.]